MMEDIILPSIYTALGILICFGNFVLILAIVCRKRLRIRKELAIIVALCIGNFVLGFGYLLMGPYRLKLVHDGQTTENTTGWHCMLLPSRPCFFYGSECVVAMQVFIAIDRLIAVKFPFTYLKLTVRHVIRSASIVYLIYGPAWLIGAFVSAYGKDRGLKYSPLCFGAWTVSRNFYVTYMLSLSLGSLLSALIYIYVIHTLKRRPYGRINSTTYGPPTQNSLIEAQIKATKLLAVVVLSTIIFYTLPYLFSILNYVFFYNDQSNDGWSIKAGTYNWISGAVYSIIVLAVYTIKQADIKHSILAGIGLYKEAGGNDNNYDAP